MAMCTVVVEVPDRPDQPTRVLAVRDEDPLRPWDPPERWWPDTHPDLLGVRDRRAGGAWLAYAPARGTLAVLVNRATPPLDPADASESRGFLPLAAIAGEPLPGRPRTEGFNLIEVDGGRSRVTSWDGDRLSREELAPGVHMIAHDDVDDLRTARIRRWLPEFSALAGSPRSTWRESWLQVLRTSTELGALDDRAIIRDNRPYGIPTMSLLICVAEVGKGGVDLDAIVLPKPGEWAG
ncbi:MAG: NRDE family protein [Tessaracoccus sp.]